MFFVLTGKGTNAAGATMDRDEIIAELGYRGHSVQSSVNGSTDYLVASRMDTSKAAAAKARGVNVISYAEMWRLVGVRSSQYTVAPSPPPRKELDLSELEQSEHWGLI